jgi:hypothetical protein
MGKRFGNWRGFRLRKCHCQANAQRELLHDAFLLRLRVIISPRVKRRVNS